MHGRPRASKHKVHGSAEMQRAALYSDLVSRALQRFKNMQRVGGADDAALGQKRKDMEEAMVISAAVIEVNPECYTMWCIRKQVLQDRLIEDVSSLEATNQRHGQHDKHIEKEEKKERREESTSTLQKIVEDELKLCEKALRRNVKSYNAWYHRKWLIEHDTFSPFVSIKRELVLVERLLEIDSRNFHAWGYRRFIAQRLTRSVHEELQYSLHHIENNFSNYSAWHFRSVVLAAKHDPKQNTETELLSHSEKVVAIEQEALDGAAPSTSPRHPGSVIRVHSFSSSMAVPLDVETLQQEFGLVQQALYTEPSDQSGWFYHTWLQGCCLCAAKQEQLQVSPESCMSSEADAFREIIEEESGTGLHCDDNGRDGGDALHGQSGKGEKNGAVKWPTLALARMLDVVGSLARGREDPKLLYEQLIQLDQKRENFYRWQIENTNT